jgi:hypothetical protein
MMAHPLALQLRNLQTLIELGVDKNTTVVFPAPLMSTISELGAFLARETAAGCRRRRATDRYPQHHLTTEPPCPRANQTRQRTEAIMTTRSDDLAVTGAIATTSGVNPHPGKRVVSSANIGHILAEMATESQYEASGDWAYTVGLSGKSGVAMASCVSPWASLRSPQSHPSLTLTRTAFERGPPSPRSQKA